MIYSGDVLSIWLAIIVAVLSVLFIGGLLARYIYRRKHHLPTGDCACCHANTNKFLKQYHKKYGCSKCSSEKK